jgi:hypothetical protein
MARRSVLRASDADREQTTERLRTAAGEGRLLTDELEHRIGAALSARTYGELDAVVADLPRGRVIRRSHRRSVARFRGLPTVALVIVIPATLALSAAVVVVIATLFAAWAIVVALAWVVLGHRARALRGPYAVARRTGRRSRTSGRAVGGSSPWL